METDPGVVHRAFSERSRLFESSATLRLLLCSAILLRLLVFTFIGVSNSDDHLAVVRYVTEHGEFPRIDQLGQAYHPPLYYLLAAAVLKVSGAVKVVQLVSLIFSIVTLLLAWYLVSRLTTLSPVARFWSLVLVSLHPQFIMYTMFISNDPLAILLGMAVVAAAYRYLRRSTFLNVILLAVVVGLGLATKFTFLAFILPAMVVVFVENRRREVAMRRSVAMLVALIVIVAALGGYKFAANARATGNAFASNLDFYSWDHQRPTWVGPRSIIDLNVTKLVRGPIVSEETVHSYPLMLFGSFWYQFYPDSTFRSNTKKGLNLLGSMIYLCAILPTVIMVVGLGIIVKQSVGWTRPKSEETGTVSGAERGVMLIAVLMLLMNVALIGSVGWKHDVFSVFNSRLLFPSYFGFMVCLSAGIDWSARHWARLHKANIAALRLLHAAFVVYIAMDVAVTLVRPVDPLSTSHMPRHIDMRQSAGR